MIKLYLNMVMLGSPVWKGMGADIEQLRAILKVRLMLDDRKPRALGQAAKQKKEVKNSTILNFFLFLVTGFMYMFPIAFVSDRILSLAIFFSFFSLSLTFMLITDFSSVLFDSRDKHILFPRPVNDATLTLSRLLHVFIYLTRIVLPFALPAWIMLGYLDGWKSALLFPVPVLLMVFIALFLVNGFYLLILKVAKGERFKDVLNYFQIVTAVIFFAGFYLIPKVFNGKELLTIKITDFPWLKFVPTYWLAACWSWIGVSVNLPGSGYLSILAVVFPFACLYILIKFLSPNFSAAIGAIDGVETDTKVKTSATTIRFKKSLAKKLANIFNRHDDAKAGFILAWLQSSRSRTFRMRVYPSFAFIPVYFLSIITTDDTAFTEAFHKLTYSSKYLLLLYMSAYVMMSALTYLTLSEQYKASWIFYATPVEKPGRIMLGAFKAIWVKYFLPIYIAISVFVLNVWGFEVVSDLVLALVNVTLLVACIARISHKRLPFSTMEQVSQGGGRILKSIVVMLVPATLGFGHYMAIHMLWLKFIFLGLSVALLWLVLDSYNNTTWAKMADAEK